MNNPNRIKSILGKIENIWTLYPTLRLGQLIVNVTALSSKNSALFYLDDEEFEKCLDRLIAEINTAENDSAAAEVAQQILDKLKKSGK